MEEEIQKEGKKSSKEMWLFLIFLDIIVLCVFAFFIYNSFFSNGFKGEEHDPFMEEVAVEDIVVVEPVAVPKTEPKTEPVKETPKPEPKAEPKKEEPKKAEAKPAAEKRQSIFVKDTGKSTREVTFKYYDDAKSVAVVGGFTMKKPIKMKKAKGEWSTSMRIFPGEYRYMLVIDGKEVVDPNAVNKDGKSVLIVK